MAAASSSQVAVAGVVKQSKEFACPTFHFKVPKSVAGESPAALDEKAVIRQAQAVVQAMWEDRSLVLPLYNALMARKEAMNTSIPKDSDLFELKMSTLKSFDEDWSLNFVMKYSDLKPTDIVTAKRFDDDAVNCLMSFLLQIPLSTRLPAVLQAKDVAMKFCQLRMQAVGGRLSLFKANGGVLESGAFN
jgi:hypothetical protein